MLNRPTKNLTFKVLAGSDTSEPVDLSNWAWGSIGLPAAIDGTSFRYHVSVGGPFVGYREPDGAQQPTLTFTAGAIFTLPQELFSACAFKLNFDTVQTVDREFTVNLKG